MPDKTTTGSETLQHIDVDVDVDVVVVGGGPAGLSAAVAPARSLRSVVVLDAGEPRNAPADGAHNVLGHEGRSPRDLLAAGRREASGYGVAFRDARAVSARRAGDRFEVTLSDGVSLLARRLLLATGLIDELPDVPGVREQWRRGVLHCAYCHGWEVRGRRIGVLGTSPAGVHQALMFTQLSDDVTLFSHGMTALGDAREQLDAVGVRVVELPVRRLRSQDGSLRAVVLDDATEVALDAVVVTPRHVARAELFEQLGGTMTEHPFGLFISTDPMTGQTDIPGVWAAGNSSDPQRHGGRRRRGRRQGGLGHQLRPDHRERHGRPRSPPPRPGHPPAHMTGQVPRMWPQRRIAQPPAYPVSHFAAPGPTRRRRTRQSPRRPARPEDQPSYTHRPVSGQERNQAGRRTNALVDAARAPRLA